MSRFLDALHGVNTGRPPVWLMRQAGRYMPRYQEVRRKYSFLEMCRNPEVAAQVTLLPIELLDVDAAILFSDILLIADLFGTGLRFEEGKGPVMEQPLQSASDIVRLQDPDVENGLRHVGKTIELLKPELKVPLIGFCGAPFTVASYMIEGGSSKDLKRTKQWMLRDPESFHLLLQKITDASIAYLRLQQRAGADALQIFDSWANVLSYSHFRTFSLPYLKQLMEAVRIPVILFCRGSSTFAPGLASLEPAAVSVDWNADLADVRRQIPQKVSLQGNLDPDILYAETTVLKREVDNLLETMRGDPAYIFNLGHGIKPDHPLDSVKFLVDSVKSSM